MAFTYDPSTPAGKVRMLARDTVEAAALFTDDEITAFLDLQNQDVKLAAADALDAVADNQVLLLKKVKLGDIGTDGPAVAEALRDSANRLRKQVYGEDDAGFEIAELNTGFESQRQIERANWLRGY